MSDEDALLAAIAAHPEEDTPRLAYADWLDEHDRPIRAEFIRVQVEIAHKQDTLPRVLLNRHVDLFKRNQELLDHHRDELLGPLAALSQTVKVEFSRGFVSDLTLDCGTLMGFEEAVRQLRPLPDITVTDVAWWLTHLETFPAVLLRATAIEMQSQRRANVTLTAFEVEERLVCNGPFDRLRRLSLEGCQIGTAGVVELTGTDFDFFSALTDLDLSGNDITDDGVRCLIEHPMWPRLRRLILGGNPISDLGAETLANAAGTSRLEHLNLRFTNIGTAGQQALLSRFGGRIDLF